MCLGVARFCCYVGLCITFSATGMLQRHQMSAGSRFPRYSFLSWQLWPDNADAAQKMLRSAEKSLQVYPGQFAEMVNYLRDAQPLLTQSHDGSTIYEQFKKSSVQPWYPDAASFLTKSHLVRIDQVGEASGVGHLFFHALLGEEDNPKKAIKKYLALYERPSSLPIQYGLRSRLHVLANETYDPRANFFLFLELLRTDDASPAIESLRADYCWRVLEEKSHHLYDVMLLAAEKDLLQATFGPHASYAHYTLATVKHNQAKKCEQEFGDQHALLIRQAHNHILATGPWQHTVSRLTMIRDTWKSLVLHNQKSNIVPSSSKEACAYLGILLHLSPKKETIHRDYVLMLLDKALESPTDLVEFLSCRKKNHIKLNTYLLDHGCTRLADGPVDPVMIIMHYLLAVGGIKPALLPGSDTLMRVLLDACPSWEVLLRALNAYTPRNTALIMSSDTPLCSQLQELLDLRACMLAGEHTCKHIKTHINAYYRGYPKYVQDAILVALAQDMRTETIRSALALAHDMRLRAYMIAKGLAKKQSSLTMECEHSLTQYAKIASLEELLDCILEYNTADIEAAATGSYGWVAQKILAYRASRNVRKLALGAKDRRELASKGLQLFQQSHEGYSLGELSLWSSLYRELALAYAQENQLCKYIPQNSSSAFEHIKLLMETSAKKDSVSYIVSLIESVTTDKQGMISIPEHCRCGWDAIISFVIRNAYTTETRALALRFCYAYMAYTDHKDKDTCMIKHVGAIVRGLVQDGNLAVTVRKIYSRLPPDARIALRSQESMAAKSLLLFGMLYGATIPTCTAQDIYFYTDLLRSEAVHDAVRRDLAMLVTRITRESGDISVALAYISALAGWDDQGEACFGTIDTLLRLIIAQNQHCTEKETLEKLRQSIDGYSSSYAVYIRSFLDSLKPDALAKEAALDGFLTFEKRAKTIVQGEIYTLATWLARYYMEPAHVDPIKGRRYLALAHRINPIPSEELFACTYKQAALLCKNMQSQKRSFDALTLADCQLLRQVYEQAQTGHCHADFRKNVAIMFGDIAHITPDRACAKKHGICPFCASQELLSVCLATEPRDILVVESSIAALASYGSKHACGCNGKLAFDRLKILTEKEKKELNPMDLYALYAAGILHQNYKLVIEVARILASMEASKEVEKAYACLWLPLAALIFDEKSQQQTAYKNALIDATSVLLNCYRATFKSPLMLQSQQLFLAINQEHAAGFKKLFSLMRDRSRTDTTIGILFVRFACLFGTELTGCSEQECISILKSEMAKNNPCAYSTYGYMHCADRFVPFDMSKSFMACMKALELLTPTDRTLEIEVRGILETFIAMLPDDPVSILMHYALATTSSIRALEHFEQAELYFCQHPLQTRFTTKDCINIEFAKKIRHNTWMKIFDLGMHDYGHDIMKGLLRCGIQRLASKDDIEPDIIERLYADCLVRACSCEHMPYMRAYIVPLATGLAEYYLDHALFDDGLRMFAMLRARLSLLPMCLEKYVLLFSAHEKPQLVGAGSSDDIVALRSSVDKAIQSGNDVLAVMKALACMPDTLINPFGSLELYTKSLQEASAAVSCAQSLQQKYVGNPTSIHSIIVPSLAARVGFYLGGTTKLLDNLGSIQSLLSGKGYIDKSDRYTAYILERECNMSDILREIHLAIPSKSTEQLDVYLGLFTKFLDRVDYGIAYSTKIEEICLFLVHTAQTLTRRSFDIAYKDDQPMLHTIVIKLLNTIKIHARLRSMDRHFAETLRDCIRVMSEAFEQLPSEDARNVKVKGLIAIIIKDILSS